MRTSPASLPGLERVQREGGINAQRTTFHAVPHAGRHSRCNYRLYRWCNDTVLCRDNWP